MLAVIKTGGKQYKVQKGTKFETERLDAKEGDKVTIEKVLLLKDGADIKIGTPLVEGAYVEAKVLLQKKGKKQIIFKMKAKKRYRKTKGFRKQITVLEVLEIKASGGKGPTLKTAEPKAEAAPKKTVKNAAPKKKTVEKEA
ncbi:MAG: 50S ribosomal protein L21 [Candidatus Gracilibacteria bacterium]|jgi:large subunit ribosomal protein L21